jgi:cytochrome c-type biogenesis protein CcmH
MLWMILTLMTVLAAVGLAIPLVRRRDAMRAQRADAVSVLKDQLGEIEAQAAAGALAEPEADALKSDLKRRVLAEGRRPDAPARPLAERRSEERRVGKECRRLCRSRWSPYH